MSLYQQPGSDVWWANITVNGQRLRVSTHEYDKKAAQVVHDKLKGAQHDAPRLKGKTWGSAVLKWAGAETRGTPDLLMLRKFGRYYVDRVLSSVTPDSIDKALKKFIKTDGSYNRYAAVIGAVLHLSGSNVKVTKRRNKSPKVRTWLTHEQWEKLYAALPKHLRPIATFALNTGLRKANVLGLMWSRVDMKRKVVWVEGSDMKAEKAIGVPLNEAAYNVLCNVEAQHPEFCFTFRSRPIKDCQIAFRRACIKAGVGRMVDGRYDGFAFHGLRHTFATWHAQNGTPDAVLLALGGWEDPRMLAKHYAHHVPGMKAKFVDNLGL
jgi:integrase